ncbi:zinc-binding alcohol dehydrogenase family protein [Roseomonas alkaliterrae]|uniref:Zinc-type alcohol dehydrogenase-like protein n=1 Tax=Neoroseomonas alkaliterrae TaxID=1452450 RepID=A0A840Y1A8_9PROT|nr:zinc-binding alcohol dehydrogenase family protein [Neoroseomonas alkaliterrae]MBB5688043.1 NADPH2:quinone reductase [Neoroseomonas alkaliterrae]MBR0675927.1 zinc-binding alcohol dehydrogenase family protein [Neoroseomonas alkaliterrae]
MKAVGYLKCHPVDHPEALLDLDIPAPAAPQGHDILVEVRAMSVNPVDTKRRRSEEPKDGPRILGFDAAGVVRAVGPACTLFRAGDEVFYAGVVNRPGSNAELQLVDERIVGRKPRTLSFPEAAALPLTSITAWEGLHDRLGIHEGAGAGEALLVIGGAGGVGSMVTQIARQRTALTIVATASRPESAAWCRSLGAHHVVDHKGDIAAQLKALGVKPRYVFSTNTTARNWEQIVASVAPQGAIVLIESQAPIDARQLMPKSVSLHWELMFTRPMFGTPDMIEQHHLLDAIADLVDHGRIRHTMTRNLGPANAARLREAHALVESGTMIGKVVLEGL